MKRYSTLLTWLNSEKMPLGLCVPWRFADLRCFDTMLQYIDSVYLHASSSISKSPAAMQPVSLAAWEPIKGFRGDRSCGT